MPAETGRPAPEQDGRISCGAPFREPLRAHICRPLVAQASQALGGV